MSNSSSGGNAWPPVVVEKCQQTFRKLNVANWTNEAFMDAWIVKSAPLAGVFWHFGTRSKLIHLLTLLWWSMPTPSGESANFLWWIDLCGCSFKFKPSYKWKWLLRAENNGMNSFRISGTYCHPRIQLDRSRMDSWRACLCVRLHSWWRRNLGYYYFK